MYYREGEVGRDSLLFSVTSFSLKFKFRIRIYSQLSTKRNESTLKGGRRIFIDHSHASDTLRLCSNDISMPRSLQCCRNVEPSHVKWKEWKSLDYSASNVELFQ